MKGYTTNLVQGPVGRRKRFNAVCRTAKVRLHDEQRVSKMIVLGDAPSDKSTAQLAAGNVELCVLSRDTPMQQLVEAVDSQCSPSALDFSDLYLDI